MNTNKLLIKELIKNKAVTAGDLALAKRKLAKKYKTSCPSNISLLRTYHELIRNRSIKKSEILEQMLKTRPIRSLSGIVNISVLTKPYPCPGKCIYCPLEKGIPKSYLSGEPAVERAKRLNYDPYLQVKKRVEMLEIEGHPTDKVELRIIGGTWSYYPKTYQEWFIKKCFQAANGTIKEKTLEQEQKTNEKAKNRIIGLSIETRPDFINEKEIKHLRQLGVTMVELGVQSTINSVLKLNQRGHGREEVIKATRLLKDAGFKILFQMMPNLPGSDLKKDEEMFKDLFLGPLFQPDLLKIYPCALLKEAPLYKKRKELNYRPYSKQQLIQLIKKIKKGIPEYVRIQRIIRDIPSEKIMAGPAKISNLRQVLSELSEKEGWQCNCIRCREIKEKYNPKEKLYLVKTEYRASEGKEIFLSFENINKKIYSLLRLRVPSEQVFIPVLKNSAVIRELHTYGPVHPIKKSNINNSAQHKGLGKELIKEAEKIAKKEFGFEKIAVISGVGARDYYRKLGYQLIDNYMVKNL